MAVTLLIVAALIAIVDWVAVARETVAIERLAKPLTLVVLAAAACTGDLGSAKVWVVSALVLGLIGDVALLFSDDTASAEPDGAFLAGLGAFLAGHVCYLIAFSRHGLHPLQAAAGLLIVLGCAALTVPQVLRGANRSGGHELAAVVGVYAATLAAMAVLAAGTGAVATAVGGLLFLGSDTALAWGRFVRPLPRGSLIVIVSYHLGQLLILVGLLR